MPSAAFVSRLGQAGVYVYHNGSDRRVYADGRLEVIRRRTYRSYLSICRLMTRGDSLWVSRVQDPFGKPPIVILDNRHARSMIRGVALTGGWRLVYADAIAAVFVTEQVARNLGLPPADAEPLLTERDRANIRSRESDR